MAGISDLARYRENCALFTTPPVPSFEAALHTGLDVCSLASAGIDDNAMVCIAESLRTNTTIRELNLGGNTFGASGAADLATALAENTTLRSLKLKSNAIGDAGLILIFTAMLNNTSSAVSTVDCSSTGVTSVGLPKLLGAIAVNKSLTALNLEGNALPAEAGGAIASALQRTSALTVLCVGSNHLGDAGIIAICRGIRTATESQPKRCPLTLLDVSRNGIGQKGSLALADLLRSPQFPLSDLLLAYNPLSQDGTVSIANAIRDAALTASRGDPKSFKLRYVDITGVDVGISGLTALKDAITSSRSVIGSGPGDSLSESGDSFEVDGLEELWIPAASAPVVGKLGLLSSSRSDVSGFSMAGPMSVVEPKAPAPEVIPPPAPTAPPLHPTAKITSASPPAPPSPPRTTPAMSPPLSQHNTQLVPLPTGSAQSSLPHSVRLESLTPNEATSMLIDLLHKQLEDQALQINELREMLSKAGKVPIGTAGRASSASLPDERDVSASKPKGLSKALELVASRGALESEADRSFRGLNSSTSGPTVSLGEWGFKSAGIATSAAKRLSAVEDAILELASEIRWVDEEGVKARLEAESLLRARVDALSSRLDTFEETVPVSTKVKAVSETPATHRYRSGSASAPHTPARPTDAVLPRDTLVKHVRINEERLVSLHGDIESVRVHVQAIEELLTNLTLRVESMESGVGPHEATVPIKELTAKVDTAVRMMSARLDEIAGGSSIGGGGKPRGVSSPPRTVGGSQSLSSMSKDDLVDLVSSMVSTQVTALASKLRGDVDKSVGSALQSMHRSLDLSQASFGGNTPLEFGEQLRSLSNRLEVLEEAVASDQEHSLSTLEAIMRATVQKPKHNTSSSMHMGDSPKATVRPVSPPTHGKGASYTAKPSSGTGILSVRITPQ